MPDIKVDDGCSIHVEVEGPERAPVLMLSNSLGTDLHMWDEQVAPFTQPSAWSATTAAATANPMCPRAPTPWRGSAATWSACSTGSALPRSIGAACRWAAWSACGSAPMRQNRIDKLILSNTSSYFPDKTMWEGRIKLVREKGLEGIVDANMERWFTKGFRDRAPEAMARMKKMFVATKVDGYVGCGEAIRDMDHRPLLSKITAPTFVIAGKHDPATPLEGNEFIKQHIPGARIAVLEAAHIANIEQPTGLCRYRAGIFARQITRCVSRISGAARSGATANH